jgi:hypothetical protein
MSRSGDETFPIGAVRDLLGVARSMHAAWRLNGWPAAEMKELELVGLDLLEALDLVHRSEPGMVEYTVALDLAESATERLCALIAVSSIPLAPVVRAAGERAKKRR